MSAGPHFIGLSFYLTGNIADVLLAGIGDVSVSEHLVRRTADFRTWIVPAVSTVYVAQWTLCRRARLPLYVLRLIDAVSTLSAAWLHSLMVFSHGHHLHSHPAPLEKAPKRPAAAGTLVDLLNGCTEVSQWTHDMGRTWWKLRGPLALARVRGKTRRRYGTGIAPIVGDGYRSHRPERFRPDATGAGNGRDVKRSQPVRSRHDPETVLGWRIDRADVRDRERFASEVVTVVICSVGAQSQAVS